MNIGCSSEKIRNIKDKILNQHDTLYIINTQHILLELFILLALVQQMKDFAHQIHQTTEIVSSEGFLCSSLCLNVNSYLVFIFLFSCNYIQAKTVMANYNKFGSFNHFY